MKRYVLGLGLVLGCHFCFAAVAWASIHDHWDRLEFVSKADQGEVNSEIEPGHYDQPTKKDVALARREITTVPQNIFGDVLPRVPLLEKKGEFVQRKMRNGRPLLNMER